jgi:hypothetical protein
MRAVPGGEREESAFHEKFASRVDLDGRPELFWVRGPRNTIPPPAIAVLTGVAFAQLVANLRRSG